MPYHLDNLGRFFSVRALVALAFLCVCLFFSPLRSFAQEAVLPSVGSANPEGKELIPVEIKGDKVEFVMEGNKVIITGNARITQGRSKLIADKIIFSKDQGVAVAEGHVAMKTPQGLFSGDKLTYNFNDQTGDFSQVHVATYTESDSTYAGRQKVTVYGYADTAAKLGENHLAMKNGYMTTCDLLNPHYKFTSKKIDIYPKEKFVARNVRMKLGEQSVLYMPKFTQALDGKPRFTFTPGYKKDWGMFMLTQYRYYFSEDFKGTVHVDFREKKDVASGVDLNYRTKNYGSGSIRTYYMNERSITSKRFYQERPTPTVERERFRSEWRHKWAVDDKTDMVLQYSKISDSTFIKDYFKREYEKDASPQSFFLLTRNFANGTASFRTDARVNRFESAVERLPEIRYDLTNQKIGDSRFYLKSANSFVNLTKKEPSPTEVRKETMRFDSENQISYPMKVGFVEMRPFVGERQTYYSKTNDRSQYNVVRGLFLTGSDLSTKFYKLYDLHSNVLGLDINKLRHVITPSASYNYNHRPTIRSDELDTFDTVDSLDQRHYIHLSLENKLQTKRKGISADLLRVDVNTDFNLKEDTGKGGFSHVKTDWDLTPTNWLRFSADTDYDSVDNRLSSANFEFQIRDPDKGKWSFDFGKRYAPDVDDQVTTEWNYRINPIWKFRIYQRMDVLNSTVKEQEYTFTRDLHCWEMDINYNETRGSGSEIWLVFRLKSFPDMGLDFGTGFNKRKTGSQDTP